MCNLNFYAVCFSQANLIILANSYNCLQKAVFPMKADILLRAVWNKTYLTIYSRHHLKQNICIIPTKIVENNWYWLCLWFYSYFEVATTVYCSSIFSCYVTVTFHCISVIFLQAEALNIKTIFLAFFYPCLYQSTFVSYFSFQ